MRLRNAKTANQAVSVVEKEWSSWSWSHSRQYDEVELRGRRWWGLFSINDHDYYDDDDYHNMRCATEQVKVEE